MKKLISLLLAAAMVLCFAACNDTTPEGVHNDILDTLVGVRYRGESSKITELAPKEYWDWYEGQGRSVEELITYSTGAYNSWLDVIGGQFGNNLTVTYTIASEEPLDDATMNRYASKMEEKFGIDAKTITDGKELTVAFTLTGSLMTDTINSNFTMVTIAGKQYLILSVDQDGEFSVSFQTY